MSDNVRRPRRLLRNYLLDRGVQLRMTLVMVLLTSALTTVLGYIWYAEIRNASGVIRVNAISVMGNEAANELAAELATQDGVRLLVLVGFGTALALLIAAYSIVMTHRLAGPLFKIRRHIEDIENNRLYELWGLRKGDQLQEFFDAFQSMHGALRNRTEGDMRLLNEAIAAIERGDDLEGLLPLFKEKVKEKGDSLREAGNVTKRIHRDQLTG